MTVLVRLWRGELPLGEAFWIWTVFGGGIVNAVTSGLFYALLVADRVPLAFIAGYALSVPYNLAVTVGVWRSASRHPDRTWAEAAKIVTLSAMVFLSVT